jgi:hypothetical protein
MGYYAWHKLGTLDGTETALSTTNFTAQRAGAEGMPCP